MISAGACYYYNEDSLSWEDAQTACEALGGKLVSVNSEDINTEILSLAGSSDAWIGLNDQTTEGTYMWSDDSTLESDDYTNWYEGEPNNYNDSEDCVAMYTNGQWNDYPCSTSLSSVC
ncbi:unnamed protein product, partial [Heterosigma akashiwo]